MSLHVIHAVGRSPEGATACNERDKGTARDPSFSFISILTLLVPFLPRDKLGSRSFGNSLWQIKDYFNGISLVLFGLIYLTSVGPCLSINYGLIVLSFLTLLESSHLVLRSSGSYQPEALYERRFHPRSSIL